MKILKKQKLLRSERELKCVHGNYSIVMNEIFESLNELGMEPARKNFKTFSSPMRSSKENYMTASSILFLAILTTHGEVVGGEWISFFGRTQDY